MNFNNLLVSQENKISSVTIHRPQQLNALNSATLTELSECISMLEEDRNTRVIFITGSGDKSFVAGADIKEFLDLDAGHINEFAENIHETVFNKIENLSKPVIAAINGFALGGGLELAMACHIRIASENARMGLPEVTLGLIPGYGGTQRLPKLVGKGWANQIILSAEMITAQKALEIGLINEVTSQGNLLPRVKELALKISKNSSTAITHAIKAIQASDSPQGFDKEIDLFGNLFQTHDFKEGVSAFVEKRKPNFN
ncbi:enoyl-CoA hydratase/isomerase family protein [Apibacter sp. HY039]|uniref:enoyl-CoA hydratase/isomerase family protein n=1 Tax=Apibacter sp. HY039 TaxID=2501476 RepID=UPI000FEC1D01|nr:enoyl-CoA hydratase-related protein [Apibacter sp. HY039]